MIGVCLSWGTVKEWKSSGLESTIADLVDERQKAMTVHDSIAAVDVTTNWEGKGASSAQEALAKLKDFSAHHLGLLGELLSATSVARDGLGEVEAKVQEAQSFAAEYDFSITDDGGVHDTRPPYDARDAVLLRANKLKECCKLIEEACEKASDVDKAYAEALNNVSQNKDADPEDFDDPTPGMPDLPKEGASTQEVAKWWTLLSDKEQRRVIQKGVEEASAGIDGRYRALGNTDGMGARARGEINLARLDYDCLHGDEKLKAEAEHIKKALNEPNLESDPNRRTLFLYDPANGTEGHEMTHAAIAVGDVDNADYVCTYVPGTTTTVESLEGMSNQMTDLKKRAEGMSGGSVATIGWVGYDCPPTLAHAALPGRAEDCGPALARHLEGIEDSRNARGMPVHQSVLGHSYGSKASSEGVVQVRPGVVDDYGVFASPGVSGKAQEMHVPEGHSYAMGFGNDPMIMVDQGYDAFDRTAMLSMLPGDSPHGTNPLMPGSGFKSLDPGNPDPKTSPHSAYLVNESQAQEQLAKVITGRAG